MTEPSIVGAMDQLQAVLRDQAKTVGVYYVALVENGIPSHIAGRAVLDWHACFCHGYAQEEDE